MRIKLKNIIVGENTRLHIQLARYVIAGTIAFAADFAILHTFTEFLRIHYLLSTVAGYCVGLIVSYLLSVLWVFDKRRIKSRLTEFISFTAIGVVGLGLTSLLMWLLTDKAGIYYLFSKIITTLLVLLWNFTAKKLILFTAK